MNESGTVRLNKFISSSGISARRKADELIQAGCVTVNGKVVTEFGYQVDPEIDEVKCDGRLVKQPKKFVYILLNKPNGYITSTSDEAGRKTVLDLIGLNQRIYPIGRLDYDTEGLLLLTNDGNFANKLMHPKFGAEKVYHARLSKPIDSKQIERLIKGVSIDGFRTSRTKISVVPNTSNCEIRISIREGKNRQIKKMLESIGIFVRRLRRIEYAGLKLKGLSVGGWRYLIPAEVKALISGERREPQRPKNFNTRNSDKQNDRTKRFN